MGAEQRARLGARQAELVAALVIGAAAPEGFDRADLEATALSLKRKRLRVMRSLCPALERALEGRLEPLFIDFASERALPCEGGALADLRGFLRHLMAEERAPAGRCRNLLRVEALRIDLHFRSTAAGLRRDPAALRVRCERLSSPSRLLIGVRVRGYGARWLSLPPWPLG